MVLEDMNVKVLWGHQTVQSFCRRLGKLVPPDGGAVFLVVLVIYHPPLLLQHHLIVNI